MEPNSSDIKIYKSIKIDACGWNAMHFVLLIIWGDWISLEPNPPSCSTYISDGQLRKEAKQSITFEAALCETTPGSNISRCFLQISFTIWCTLKPAFQHADLVLFKCFMEYSTKNTSATHDKKFYKYNFFFVHLKDNWPMLCFVFIQSVTRMKNPSHLYQGFNQPAWYLHN